MSIKFESDRRKEVRRDDDYCPMTREEVNDMLDNMHKSSDNIKRLCERLKEIEKKQAQDHDLLMIRTGPIEDVKEMSKTLNQVVANQRGLKIAARIIVIMVSLMGAYEAFVRYKSIVIPFAGQ